MKSLTLGPFSHNTDKINYFMFFKNTKKTNNSRYLSTGACKQLMELPPSRIADPEKWENYSLCWNCHRQNRCRLIPTQQNPWTDQIARVLPVVVPMSVSSILFFCFGTILWLGLPSDSRSMLNNTWKKIEECIKKWYLLFKVKKTSQI